MDFCEFQKEYGPGIGIAMYGDMDLYEEFYMQYYYPYFLGTGVTSNAEVYIERRMDRESYVGICEDMKIGISLIFYLQNIVEYLKERQRTESVKYKSVTLSGLCDGGTVLLPVRKDKSQEQKQREDVHNRMKLMNAARTGDPAAIESLTLDDIDTYFQSIEKTDHRRRITIVDTYIITYGFGMSPPFSQCLEAGQRGTGIIPIINDRAGVRAEDSDHVYAWIHRSAGFPFPSICLPDQLVGFSNREKEETRILFAGIIVFQGSIMILPVKISGI